MLKKLFSEPLLHFLLIGAALFLLYGQLNDEATDETNRIVISKADLDRLVALWKKTWQRSPTESETEGLIKQQIREEVLYREALAMGLDQNDTIIRRRLAQKVEFISADLASQAKPSEEELKSYLANYAGKFTLPGRISFRQIYFNADRRGARAEDDAKLLLTNLTQSSGPVDTLASGDPFMLGDRHEQLTARGVARLFGEAFAGQLFTLPVGSWQGPIPSGYGLHLVHIDNKSADQQPGLDSVRERVKEAWLNDQQKKTNEAFYLALKKRYEIVVESGSSGNNEGSVKQ